MRPTNYLMRRFSFILLFEILRILWVVDCRTYDGNIWDFEGETAAEQIIYGTNSDSMFGYSVSTWGDRVVIGEISGNNYKGQVSVYTHLDEQGQDVGWYLESTLTDQYGEDGDLFGCAVSLYATTVVVGAKHKDWNNYEDSGSAFIYEIHLNKNYEYEWTFVTELTRDDAEPQDYFGNAVGIYGNTTVVGCYGCDPSGTMSGAVYVYAKYYLIDDDGTVTYQWNYHHTMTSPSGSRYDWFGFSLAIYDDVVAVSATGMDDPISLEGNTGGAYVFDVVPDDTYADGINWKVFAELAPGDGVSGDGFGTSIAVYDGIVVIGSPYAFTGSYHSGAVYIYHKDKYNHWSFEFKLTPMYSSPQLHFGYAVSVYKDILLVGALNQTGVNSVSLYGKEYEVADQSNIYWDLIYELQPVHQIVGDQYGSAISIFESLIVIGAPMATSPWEENNQNQGKGKTLYLNGAIHIYWATNRISIEYISKDIKVRNFDDQSPHVTVWGVTLSCLFGLIIGGYVYFAAASYMVKLEEEEEKTKLLTQNKDSKQYQQTSMDSSHGPSHENKIDISIRDEPIENSHEKNQELLRASLARLSNRSSHSSTSTSLSQPSSSLTSPGGNHSSV